MFTIQNKKPASSITALCVTNAIIICAMTKTHDYLVPKEMLELAQLYVDYALQNEESLLMQTIGYTIQSMPYWAQRSLFNKMVSPGYDIRITMRKLMIQQQVEQAIAQNAVEQIIILGDGYSPLVEMLYDKHPETIFIAIDRGKTRDNKISALQQSKFAKCLTADNTAYLECDLTSMDLRRTLSNCDKYSSKHKTLFLAEGITMYIEKNNELPNFIMAIRDLSKQNDLLLMSFMQPAPLSSKNNNFQVVSNFFQSMRKESYKSKMYPGEVQEFMSDYHFNLEKKALHQDLLKTAEATTEAASVRRNYPKEHFYLFTYECNLNPNKKVENIEVHLPPLTGNSQTSFCRLI